MAPFAPGLHAAEFRVAQSLDWRKAPGEFGHEIFHEPLARRLVHRPQRGDDVPRTGELKGLPHPSSRLSRMNIALGRLTGGEHHQIRAAQVASKNFGSIKPAVVARIVGTMAPVASRKHELASHQRILGEQTKSRRHFLGINLAKSSMRGQKQELGAAGFFDDFFRGSVPGHHTGFCPGKLLQIRQECVHPLPAKAVEQPDVCHAGLL